MTHSCQDLADANLIEAIREHARWQSPCECVETDGVLMVAGANDFPIAFRNCVARVDGTVHADRVLALAGQFFGERGRSYAVIVRGSRDGDIEATLRAKGLAPTADSPCMLIESPLAEPAIPPGILIERFDNEQRVMDAVRVNEEAYEAIKLPAEEKRAFFGKPAALLSKNIIGFVAYRDAVPVATALTILSGESAGVYWVGTATHARRAGLGELCTRLATNAGSTTEPRW